MLLKVVVPTYNAAKWIEECLRSISAQQYGKFECLVIDDASTDGTFETIAKLSLDERFTILRNPTNIGPLANTWFGFERLGCRFDAEAVLTIVDGDDRLAHDRAFDVVKNAYDSDSSLLMTYGNYANDQTPQVGMCGRFDDVTILTRSFRKSHCCVSCLRTFKARLWNNLQKSDLIDPQTGRFFAAGGDVAYLLPLLDMAGSRFRFIEEIIYYYNTGNPMSDFRIRTTEQSRVDRLIRSMPRYPILP